MKLIQAVDYEDMSRQAFQHMVGKIQTSPRPVLGLATGSTPLGVYRHLIEAYQKGNVSFAHTVTFNLDEYAGLAADDPNSYRYYMNNHFFHHIDIPVNQTNIPNGNASDLEAECRRYEALLEEKQQIDVQLLGLGVNGHIGFNEPGTSFSSPTHVVQLAPVTRKANARFFEKDQDVPTKAITMGIGTIMKSKEIVLLASGASKAKAVRQLIHGEVTEAFPASVLQTHPNVTVIADKKALAETTLVR